MEKPRLTPALTQRKRREASGRVLATYECWRCKHTWQAYFPAPWALTDPRFKRDVCDQCETGAAILRGYVPSLDLDGAPEQLELGL